MSTDPGTAPQPQPIDPAVVEYLTAQKRTAIAKEVGFLAERFQLLKDRIAAGHLPNASELISAAAEAAQVAADARAHETLRSLLPKP